MMTLMDSVPGRFRLKTWSKSEHVVDLDQSELIRIPYVVAPAPEMARDSLPAELLRICACTVGHSAIFGLNLSKVGTLAKFRTTSVVESIEIESRSAHDG
ncbi:hypothetical protein DF223_10740 [Mycetocola zhujimingii]|uniref:Uncharacterized protein n=1 Tax=Mycetocola zhujimingii TaxID=2079792 RepID=A0A2U1TCG0_9MICO|nr:hypothetical protein DF223_10740 [Mycetocola zhujimingii]